MPGDHQDLLEDLRRLRQRVELAGMHAARHQVVARPFRRRLGQDRRLDLPEAVRVEVAADRDRRAVAQVDVVLQPRPPQIEIAVAQPHVLRHRRVFGDLKRRRLGFVEQRESRAPSTSTSPVASFGLTASAERRSHAAEHADDELARAAAWPTSISALVLAHHHLREAVRDRGYRGTSRRRGRGRGAPSRAARRRCRHRPAVSCAAGMGARQVAKRFNAHGSMVSRFDAARRRRSPRARARSSARPSAGS